MKNKQQLLKNWYENGYVNIPFLTEEEISDIRKEGKRLLIERDSNWEKHGIEGSQPYRLPHTESVIFEKIIKDKRIHEVAKLFMCNDLNLSECDLQVNHPVNWVEIFIKIFFILIAIGAVLLILILL